MTLSAACWTARARAGQSASRRSPRARGRSAVRSSSFRWSARPSAAMPCSRPWTLARAGCYAAEQCGAHASRRVRHSTAALRGPSRLADAASTSAARTTPPGPEPRNAATSIPRSSAIRRALGDDGAPPIATLGRRVRGRRDQRRATAGILAWVRAKRPARRREATDCRESAAPRGDLVRREDHRDDPRHRHFVAHPRAHLGEHAARGGFEVHGGFVRLDGDERLRLR